ncbi:MAG: hypothetical protein M1531_09710 [Chloroflexi bacterium]|nr:hypothetical protein [Chloroflexota bacterium]
MPKRAAVPEGKALFFRTPDGLGETPAKAASSEKEPTRQSAVFLEERHLDWLDDRCREARRNGGRAIRKAAIIRALLDVAMQAPIDLTGLRRVEELEERIKRGLQAV